MQNGNLKTEGVVTTILPIEEWEKGFDLATGREGDLKVVLKFD